MVVTWPDPRPLPQLQLPKVSKLAHHHHHHQQCRHHHQCYHHHQHLKAKSLLLNHVHNTDNFLE